LREKDLRKLVYFSLSAIIYRQFKYNS